MATSRLDDVAGVLPPAGGRQPPDFVGDLYRQLLPDVASGEEDGARATGWPIQLDTVIGHKFSENLQHLGHIVHVRLVERPVQCKNLGIEHESPGDVYALPVAVTDALVPLHERPSLAVSFSSFVDVLFELIHHLLPDA